ncbi:alpha-tocopherol transfer protein-like [Diorhabda carinulata]|uniref:alpha-tocopherol transfer protein-like n=1 Tax=Diorhabda carinulata TaxID=1163345 RepID=UPI0025A2F798|nr:alpha-tocopherol transfer protein-like [Diorhabda carinulata]
MENENKEQKYESFKEFEKLAREKNINRLDKSYLRRFFVGRQYDTVAALKALQNYESFVKRRKERWLTMKKTRIELLIQYQIVEILLSPGIQGQYIVWIRLENWDPGTVEADEILEFSGLLCELLYAEADEIHSIDIIVDLHNFSLKHLYGLSPKFAKRMVFFMAECLPMIMSHIYVVRQPKIFYLVYSLFKPFLDENIRKTIKICGHNYQLLTGTIGKHNLPIEFDGTVNYSKLTRWLNIFHNNRTQKGLKLAGYEFV